MNYELHPDTSLLQSNQTPIQGAECLPVLREEAVCSLKAGKSPRMDSIASELLKNGGEATTAVLTVICQKDLGDEGMARSSYFYKKKRDNLKQYKNYTFHQPNQLSQQYAPSYPRPTQDQGCGTVGRRTSRF